MNKQELIELLQNMVPMIVNDLVREPAPPPRHEHTMTLCEVDGTPFEPPGGGEQGWIFSSVELVSLEGKMRACVLWHRSVHSVRAELPEETPEREGPSWQRPPPAASNPPGPVEIEPLAT